MKPQRIVIDHTEDINVLKDSSQRIEKHIGKAFDKIEQLHKKQLEFEAWPQPISAAEVAKLHELASGLKEMEGLMQGQEGYVTWIEKTIRTNSNEIAKVEV